MIGAIIAAFVLCVWIVAAEVLEGTRVDSAHTSADEVCLATFQTTPHSVLLSLENYPELKVACALDRMSILGKCQQGPDNANPQSAWVWEISKEAFSGVKLFLERSRVRLEEKKEAPEATLG